MRRRRLILLCIFVLMAIGAAWTYRVAEERSVERWIGREVQRIANHYLQPKLRFASLEYHEPLTVVLNDVSLEAADPQQTGATVRILQIKKAELQLAKVPRYGEPLVIKRFVLDEPEVKFLTTAAPDPATGKTEFIGYSHLLAPSKKTAKKPAGSKDLVTIEQIDIHGGTILYDPHIADTEPLVLDGIGSTLKIDHPPATTMPTATAASQPQRAYTVHFTAKRDPVFQLATHGRIDLATETIDLRQCDVHLDLKPENFHFLPPQLQRVLNTYQVKGELTTATIGTLCVNEMRNSQLFAWVSLEKGHVLADGYHFGVPKLAADVRMLDGRLRLENLTAEALGGTVDATGVFPCKADDTVSFRAKAEDLQLERTLRVLAKTPHGTTSPSSFVGKLSGEVAFSAPVKAWRTEAQGAGWMKLRQAQLPDMPVLGNIVNGIAAIGKVVGVEHGGNHDKADAEFTITGDRIFVKKLTAESAAMGMRGTGVIAFNGKMDLHVNAGPLEWAENILGPVGRLMGALTDRVAGYEVTGTAKKPHVAMQVGPWSGKSEEVEASAH